MSAAVASPATTASAEVCSWSRWSTTTAKTAAAPAPALMPMTSGEASGLRSIVWKVTPAMPSALPTRRARTARGRRSSPTVKLAPGTVCPRMTRHTSPGP